MSLQLAVVPTEIELLRLLKGATVCSRLRCWRTESFQARSGAICSAVQQLAECEGVPDRVTVSIVVEVDEDVLAGSVPFV
jgi:hypothetical protein